MFCVNRLKFCLTSNYLKLACLHLKKIVLCSTYIQEISMDNIETQKSYTYLKEVETIAQDILTLRDTKLQVANAQNKYREALRALQGVEDRNTWFQVGSVYVHRPTKECEEILQNEASRTEGTLTDLQNEIREKTHKLRDLEHQPRLEGFTLKPISVTEAKALHKGFGQN